MKQFIALLITSAVFVVACVSARINDRLPAGEGFYKLDGTIPPSAQVDSQTVQRSSQSVGLLLSWYETTFTPDRIKVVRKKNCDPSLDLSNIADYCRQITSPACDNGCVVKYFWPECTVGKLGRFAVTAKHCVMTALQNPIVRFGDGAEGAAESRVGPMKESIKRRPYDIALLEVLDPKSLAAIPDLRPQIGYSAGDPVYAIGFPRMTAMVRPHKNEDYGYSIFQKRVAFGKIVDPNSQHLSYCYYSNDNEKAHPEAWILEQDCSKSTSPQPGYESRIEQNPMITSTDMIYGMSGSILFNASGDFIGVGSTVKVSNPSEYSEQAPAIYSKAENLTAILENE
jgi:hypothetical protein